MRARDDASHLIALLAMNDREPSSVIQEIRDIAHRLVGTAGTFGFMEVSAAAGDLVLTIENNPRVNELTSAVHSIASTIEQMRKKQA